MLPRTLGRGGCSEADPKPVQAGEYPNDWNWVLQSSKKPDSSRGRQQGAKLDLHAVPTATKWPSAVRTIGDGNAEVKAGVASNENDRM